MLSSAIAKKFQGKKLFSTQPIHLRLQTVKLILFHGAVTSTHPKNMYSTFHFVVPAASSMSLSITKSSPSSFLSSYSNSFPNCHKYTSSSKFLSPYSIFLYLMILSILLLFSIYFVLNQYQIHPLHYFYFYR